MNIKNFTPAQTKAAYSSLLKQIRTNPNNVTDTEFENYFKLKETLKTLKF